MNESEFAIFTKIAAMGREYDAELAKSIIEMIGPIDMAGDPKTDAVRMDNLKRFCFVVSVLVLRLDMLVIADYDHADESRRKAAAFAYGFTTRVLGKGGSDVK